MARHTEGPWQSQHDFDREGQLTIIGAIDGPDGGPSDFHFTTVCVVEEGEEATANARMIAATTDLLDAARKADAVLRTMYPTVISDRDAAKVREAFDGLGAAIAKATGEARS